MAEEQVTAPDQHKPLNRKWWRIGGIISIVALLSMLRPFNNHTGSVEDLYLIGIAGLIAAIMIADAVMVRNGLRR